MDIDTQQLRDLAVSNGAHPLSGKQFACIAGGLDVQRKGKGTNIVPGATPGLGVQRGAVARGEVEEGEDGEEVEFGEGRGETEGKRKAMVLGQTGEGCGKCGG